jgi:hypothetical protein
MRRKEGRGEKELSGATDSSCARMLVRDGG